MNKSKYFTCIAHAKLRIVINHAFPHNGYYAVPPKHAKIPIQ